MDSLLSDVSSDPVFDGLSVIMLKSVGFSDADTVDGLETLKQVIKKDSVLAFESTQTHFEELTLPFEVYEYPFNDCFSFRWSAVTPLRLGLRLMGGRLSLHHEKGIRLAGTYVWVDLKDFGNVFGLGFEKVLTAFGNTEELKAGVLTPVFLPPLMLGGIPYMSGLDNLPVVYGESLELRQITFPYKEQRTELLNVPHNWKPNGSTEEVIAPYLVGFSVMDDCLKVLKIGTTEPYPASINVDPDGFVSMAGKIERSRLFSNPVNGESFWRLQIWIDMPPAEGPEKNPITGINNVYQTVFECVIPNRNYDLAVSANKDVFVEVSSLVFAGVFSPMGTTSDELFDRTPAA